MGDRQATTTIGRAWEPVPTSGIIAANRVVHKRPVQQQHESRDGQQLRAEISTNRIRTTTIAYQQAA
jgi:hypothetical protein